MSPEQAHGEIDALGERSDIEAYQSAFATMAEEPGLAKQLVLLVKRNKGIFTTVAAAWLLITALAVWFVVNLRTKEQRALAGEAAAVAEKEATRQSAGALVAESRRGGAARGQWTGGADCAQRRARGSARLHLEQPADAVRRLHRSHAHEHGAVPRRGC